MKKILFVITKSNWGGAQRYVFDVATSLPHDQFEVAVAMGGTGEINGKPGALAQKLQDAGVRTIFIQSFMRDISMRKDIDALRELTDLFKKEKPDVVHLNSSKAGGIGALAARVAGVKKIIFTSHGLAYDEDRNIFARAAIWCGTWATFLLCHRVIVISNDGFNRASKIPFAASKIHLVHNGINQFSLKTKEESRMVLSPQQNPVAEPATSEGFVKGPTVWVGTISELTWNKGLHYLIRAIGILKRKGVDCKLVIVGGGEERGFLETRINEEGLEHTVHFAGFVPNANEYLKAFDIFALASVKEGLPYVLMEAGRAGLPVVASRIAGNSDIVGDQVSGLLFENKNASDLAEQLKKLIDSPALRTQYGEALQKRIESEFSLKNMVEQTCEIYQH